MDNKQEAKTGDALNAAITLVLRVAQKDARITDVALAEKVQVKVQTMRRWMADERPMPATPFVRIAEELGVDPSEVVRRARLQLSEEV